MRYDRITIIYNPTSAGGAAAKAKVLLKKLRVTKVGRLCQVELLPTKYPQHGRALACEVALDHERPLIVSVSGDGGFHDVVNGVFDARQKRGDRVQATVAAVPAGNANDFYRVVYERSLEEIIDEREPVSVDCLEVTIQHGDDKRRHIAHSYAGFGVTARAARGLNRIKTTRFGELKIVWQTLHYYPGVRLRLEGVAKRYDSVIAANINEMAKIVTLGPETKLADGKFELVVARHVSRARFYTKVLRAIVWHEPEPPAMSEVTIGVEEVANVQMDGEVVKCEAGSEVRIRSLRRELRLLR